MKPEVMKVRIKESGEILEVVKLPRRYMYAEDYFGSRQDRSIVCRVIDFDKCEEAA